MRALILLAGLSLAATASLASEHYFKWQDANGVWHYSQQPPPDGVESERISIASGRTEAAPLPTAPADGGADAAGSGTSAEADRRRMAACENARANVATIQNNPKVTMLDPDGTERTLTPEETRRQLEAAKAQITLHCDPAASR